MFYFLKSPIAAAIAGLVLAATAKHSNAITSSPPMGYSPFYWVQQQYNQSVMVNAATAMLEDGLYDARYNRLNLDGGWASSLRDGNRSLTWNTTKFPNGMPWLAAFAKSKGFIPGMFTQAGTEACKFHAFPGSYGHEKLTSTLSLRHSDEVWGKWYQYLEAAGWPMYMVSEEQVYLINNQSSAYNQALDFTWQHGPSARTSGDSAKYWEADSWAINLRAYEHNMRASRYQTAGFLNDPDKLTPGNPYLTLEQCKSLFALWCSMSAPLILSANMSDLSGATLKYLTNQHLLDVDQDKLMAPATLTSRDHIWDVLTKSLSNGDRLLTLFNRGNASASLDVSWSRLGYTTNDLTHVKAIRVTDLWTGKQWQVPTGDGYISASDVVPDGTAVLRIAPVGHSTVTPTGAIFNLYIPVYGGADLYPTTCLTDDRSGQVYWSACDASDAQMWTVAENGHVSSLLRPKSCLADVDGFVRSRNGRCDKWSYYRSGNLRSKSTHYCLTGGTPEPNMAGSGLAEARTCQFFSIDQIFGLPGGVSIVDGQKLLS